MNAQHRAAEPSGKYLAEVQPATIREFDVIATASNGVAKIRELLVTLAAAGRLFASSMDTPTRKLGEISEFVMGQAPPGAACNIDGQGTVFVKTGEFGPLFPVVREWTTQPLKHARTGDVLICVVGATIGKLNLAIDCAIGRSVAAIRPGPMVDTKYLYFMLMPFTLSLRRGSRGSAQGVIGKVDLARVAIRLPLLAEQRRIVARVEELMKLCDALDAHGRLGDEQHARLTSTLFDALAASESAHALAENWQRIAKHFDLLLDRPEAIDALEQTILQLAVCGLVVRQDSREGSAEAQLFEIRERKDGLVRSRKIKAAPPSLAVDPLAVDHVIPESWVWVRLGDICELITDGTHQTPKYTQAGRIFLSAQNVKPFRFMPAKHRFVSEEDYQGYIKNFKPERSDVLLTRVGAGIGEAATLDVELDFAIYVSLGLVRPVRGFVLSDYITLWLNSPDGTAKSSRNTYGKGVSQGNLNLSLIRNFLVPLPPLAEQNRIVARVEELRRLCAKLCERLTSARRTQSQLAEALVAELA